MTTICLFRIQKFLCVNIHNQIKKELLLKNAKNLRKSTTRRGLH